MPKQGWYCELQILSPISTHKWHVWSVSSGEYRYWALELMGLMLNTSEVNIHLISVRENKIFVKRSILAYINMMFPVTKWHLADLHSGGKNQVRRPSLWLWQSCWLSYNPAYKSNPKNNHQNEHDHRQHQYLNRLIVALLRQSQVGFVFHPKDKDEWIAAFQIVDSYWRKHLYEYDSGSYPECQQQPWQILQGTRILDEPNISTHH